MRVILFLPARFFADVLSPMNHLLTKYFPISRQLTVALFLFFTGTLFSTAAFSQPARPWVLKEKLDANNGMLPQSSVVSLYFDDTTGILWLSTEAGLVRYNGKFSATYDKEKLGGIVTPRFSSFIKTPSGNVYAAVRSAAAVPEKRFVLLKGFNAEISNPDQKEKEELIRATDNRDDTFWISRKDFVSYNKGSYTISLSERVNILTAPAKFTHAYFFADHGELFAKSADNRVILIDKKKPSISLLETPSLFEKQGSEFFHYKTASNNLLKSGNEIFLLKRAGLRLDLVYLATLPFDIPDLSSLLFQETTNQLFCGTVTNGLYIFSKPNFFTYQIDSSVINVRRGYNLSTYGYNNVYSTIVLNNSRYALTTDRVVFDLNTGKTYDAIHEMNLNRIFNFEIDDTSFLWGFGTAIMYKTSGFINGHIREYKLPDSTKYLAVCKASDGKAWAFYDNKFGYFENGTLKIISNNLNWLPDSVKPVLTNNVIVGPVVGPLNKTQLLFFCENYLYSLDTITFAFRKIADVPAFTKIDYRSILRENERYYWITTYGNGIILIDLKENKLYKAPVDSRKFLLYAHLLVPDGAGNFLIPTNKGLFRINRAHLLKMCLQPEGSLLYEYYDTRNGLKEVEFNGGCLPAYHVLPDGDMLFPSIGGLVRVIKSSFRPAQKYPLFIEQVRSVTKTYAYEDGMHFGSDERTLNWQLNFSNWSPLFEGYIYYRLDASKKWIPLSSRDNIISLTELSGGEHSLQIKVIFSLDEKEVSVRGFSFYVEKRYYEKAWFWILVALAVSGLAFLSSFIRNRQIKQKNKLLQMRIEEKTIQLQEKQTELQEKNTELEEMLSEANALMEIINDKSDFQKKLIRLIGHDVMIPLQFIAKTAHQLGVHKDKLSPSLRDETTAEISTTSTGLLYLSQSIIQWIKLQESGFRLSLSEFKPLKSLQEILPLHIKLLAAKQNELDMQIEPDLVFRYDETAFRIIVHNLVMNSNKFTSAGKIKVHCYKSKKEMYIEVTDTGMGMPPAIAAELNRLNAVSPSIGTESETGWGLGYKVIIELVKVSNGSLLVDSAPGKGTSVNIILPFA